MVNVLLVIGQAAHHTMIQSLPTRYGKGMHGHCSSFPGHDNSTTEHVETLNGKYIDMIKVFKYIKRKCPQDMVAVYVDMVHV
jgi:hypothetical protein